MASTDKMANTDSTEVIDHANWSRAYKEIVDLAHRVSTKAVFYEQVLSCIARPFQCPYAQIYVHMSTEVVDNYWHMGATDPDFWRPAASRFLNESLSDNRSNLRLFNRKHTIDSKKVLIALISAPLHNENGSTIGMVVLVVPCRDQAHAQLIQLVLESLLSLVSHSAGMIQGSSRENGAADCGKAKYLAKVAGYTSRHELAFAITNNLRNKTECDLVALGLVERRNVKMIAISGHDEVKKNSSDIIRIRQAMEECLDLDASLFYQQKHSTQDYVQTEYRLHRQWCEASGHHAVASVPLHDEQDCVAIVSLKRNGALPFTQKELKQIREWMEPYAGAFELIDRANQGLLAHAKDSVVETIQSVVQPKGWIRKIMVGLLGIFLAWFFFGTMMYEITATGTVVPEQIRHISAPLEGVLKSAAVVQGDSVKQGDVLCVFNHDELLLERQQLLARLQISQLEEDQARAKGLNVEVALARANQELVQAKLDMLNHRIDQSVVRASFDGLAISGDLRKRIGEVLPQGEPLYEISPSGKWLIELEIPEQAASNIAGSLPGRFAANAKPEISHALTILRMDPMARFYNGHNIFIAEAAVDMDPGWVKAGMKGIAKVEVERRPVWWVVFHRLVDYVRLNLWV
jgi:hypothetical protein